MGICPDNVLEDTLTLFQPRGADYVHQLGWSQPCLENFRRACHTYGLRIRFSLWLRHLSCLVTRKCNYDNYRLRKKTCQIESGKENIHTYIIWFLLCVTQLAASIFSLFGATRRGCYDWPLDNLFSYLIFCAASKIKDFPVFFPFTFDPTTSVKFLFNNVASNL